MTDRLRVCMILEGSYPYITGGVGAWVHDILSGLPDIEFSLLTLSPSADQPLRYTLPPNVVEHKDVVLSASTAKTQRRPRRTVVDSILKLHERMFKKEVPDIMGTLAVRNNHENFGNGLLADDRLWNMIVGMNMRRNPAYAFSDYFWAWQSAHRMMFEVLRIRAPRADVYHAISTGFAGLAALNAKSRTGKPFLLTEHGLYHKEREMEIRKADFVKGYQRDMWINIYSSLSVMCYRNADTITSLFEENRRKQIELGAKPERCFVIPNGIDIERFSSVKRSPRPGFHVGLVGRIVPIKDVKTFIAVAKIVLDRLPEAMFYAIGPTDEDEEYYEECVALVESLRIQDHCIFTGRQNVLEYYSFLDVMMLTSVREAQPLVILEGWVAGVPSICTKVGNAPEMLDYDERFLAASKDPGSLAEAVLYVHGHPEEMRAINEKNRQKAMTLYNKRDMKARYGELYESMKGGQPWQA
ncbi:MAG: GT4 family glycosyltransferase PelF [Spirochaetales bacterium]|nr:GT4 family glycosyltransferase PelF [Spirochaetales bacterium]